MRTLRRWGGEEIWIESGTYLGDTAQKLSKFANKVFTIEPSERLYKKALFWNSRPNIQFLRGESQLTLPKILESISGGHTIPDISIFLDGHYSFGDTYEGDEHTPILQELEIIGDQIHKFGNITIFVDDVRNFIFEGDGAFNYPNIELIIAWAKHCDLIWTIENDIFIAINSGRASYLNVCGISK